MKVEDEQADNMSLSNLKVPRVARNVMKMWKCEKKAIKIRKLKIINLIKQLQLYKHTHKHNAKWYTAEFCALSAHIQSLELHNLLNIQYVLSYKKIQSHHATFYASRYYYNKD